MTPTALVLMAKLRKDAAYWRDLADMDDLHSGTVLMARARRDLLDSLVQALPRDLAQIEREAAEAANDEATRAFSWLDRGAGVGHHGAEKVGAYPSLAVAREVALPND